ncbi:MAG: DNA-binding protein [Rhodocyclaceae bacterium]|jgi:DNA-binding Lrp family transcriptional regulator|nr:MAG: DNA-binding protein [Rhodocyclaceae bacterium]
MSQPANDLNVRPATTTEGLDELFDAEVLPGTTESVQAGSPYLVGPTDRGPTEGLPVEEAARILGISPKTVKDRLRKGTLTGFKRRDRFGEKWMVVLPGPTDSVGGGIPGTTESVQVGRPYQVGATNEESAVIEAYKEQIKQLQNKLDAASYRLGYLEHEREKHVEEIKLLTDSQHKPGWWARFTKWCAGQ